MGLFRGPNHGLVLTVATVYQLSVARHAGPFDGHNAEVPFTRASKRAAVHLYAPQAR
jgi:hypothetical protein